MGCCRVGEADGFETGDAVGGRGKGGHGEWRYGLRDTKVLGEELVKQQLRDVRMAVWDECCWSEYRTER